jgi:hypothetical protein
MYNRRSRRKTIFHPIFSNDTTPYPWITIVNRYRFFASSEVDVVAKYIIGTEEHGGCPRKMDAGKSSTRKHEEAEELLELRDKPVAKLRVWVRRESVDEAVGGDVLESDRRHRLSRHVR